MSHLLNMEMEEVPDILIRAVDLLYQFPALIFRIDEVVLASTRLHDLWSCLSIITPDPVQETHEGDRV